MVNSSLALLGESFPGEAGKRFTPSKRHSCRGLLEVGLERLKLERLKTVWRKATVQPVGNVVLKSERGDRPLF